MVSAIRISPIGASDQIPFLYDKWSLLLLLGIVGRTGPLHPHVGSCIMLLHHATRPGYLWLQDSLLPYGLMEIQP